MLDLQCSFIIVSNLLFFFRSRAAVAPSSLRPLHLLPRTCLARHDFAAQSCHHPAKYEASFAMTRSFWVSQKVLFPTHNARFEFCQMESRRLNIADLADLSYGLFTTRTDQRNLR